MIIGNGFLVNKLPMTMMSAKVLVFNKTDKPFGYGVFDKTSSNPEGFGMKAINKPIFGGSISSSMSFTIDNDATMTSGINIVGSNDLEFDISANANLVASLSGLNTLAFEPSLALSSGANISGINTLEFNTLASPTALVNIESTNTIAFQVVGSMSALAGLSTGNEDIGITPASIWSYSSRTLTEGGTSVGGLTLEQQAQLDAIEANTSDISLLL